MNMIDVNLPDGRVSRIYVGEHIANLQHYVNNKHVVVITERAIYELYKQHFMPNAPVIFIDGGETNKLLSTVEYITAQLIEFSVDRGWLVVGVGGGIVCDITGFAASIYMRGLRFGFVATTLLAQVDASVGGKNGVNFDGYKNMLGTFNQPDFVLCDTNALKTLPVRELHAGLAEVVKIALLADSNLFSFLEQNVDKILTPDTEVINHLVKRCVEIKASVVAADEREAGERYKLNLGHTFGHAIEKHDKLLHGEAVSIGLVIAARMSQQLSLITAADVSRIELLLTAFGLPTHTNVNKNLLLDAVTKDKKKHNQSVNFVLNNGIGKAKVQSISFDELRAIFEECVV